MSQNMLAEAYEAVVGAVYTDGGFEASRLALLNALSRSALLCRQVLCPSLGQDLPRQLCYHLVECGWPALCN